MKVFYKTAKVKKFKNELRKTILLVSLTIVIIFSILFYFLVQFLGVNIVASQNHASNHSLNHQLSQQLEIYEEYILYTFETNLAPKLLQVDISKQSLYEDLYHFVNTQKVGSIFHLIDLEGNPLISSSYAQSQPAPENLFLSGIYRQMRNVPNEVMMQLNKVQLSNNARTVYSIGKGLQVDNQTIGYIVFDLLEQDLNQLVQENPVDIIVITDEFQNSVLSTDTTVLNHIGKFEPSIQKGSYTFSIRNQKHYIYETKSSNQNLRIYTLTSHQFLNSLYLAGFITQILIVFVSIIGITHVANHFASKNTQSLDQLLVAIDEVRHGNLDTQLNIDTYQEFGQVSTYFNEMLENLVSLIQENNELFVRNNISEIRQLEAQFNPHFLFNALESLKYLIRFQSKDAESFVMKLAGILRYSISTNDEFVTLERDLKHIQDYLDIQKVRYNQRVFYEFEVDEGCRNALIPKLMIQPLVENCLNHGYSQKPLMIRIKVLVVKEVLHLLIEDDGIGFTSERLQEVQNLLSSEYNDTDHIGIYNVHRRLVLQYGKLYGINITSVYQKRTTVTITLPLRLKEDTND